MWRAQAVIIWGLIKTTFEYISKTIVYWIDAIGLEAIRVTHLIAIDNLGNAMTQYLKPYREYLSNIKYFKQPSWEHFRHQQTLLLYCVVCSARICLLRFTNSPGLTSSLYRLAAVTIPTPFVFKNVFKTQIEKIR